MIRPEIDAIGESSGVETIARSDLRLLDPAETTRQLAEAQQELLDTTAALARVQAERDSLLAEREGALITKVGQRVMNAAGETLVVAQFVAGEQLGFNWLLRHEKYGTNLRYDSKGDCFFGSAKERIVGPAPDSEELAQAKADAARYLAELKALKRRTGNFYTVDSAIRDIACCDVEAMVLSAINEALDTAIHVQHMRLPILVQIPFAGDTNVAPLHLEGEAWNQFIDGDVLWSASLVESEWKDGRFVGAYDVKAR